jgi:nucleoside-diphosphate-sugar epimerase
MHTILGAGGAVANELLKELRKNNQPYQLVSRNPKPIAGERWIAADITNANSVREAIKGSTIVYLTAGLKYDIKVWQEQWPKIMNNVIEACKHENAKLIFFDNVYSYGLVKGKMTEETPYNPISKKGEVRAKIATQLMDETKKGNLKAIIARAADYYGPKYEKAFFNILVFQRLAKGGSAMLTMSDKTVHTYSYTPDMGKPMYLLSQHENAFNQVWHLPTTSELLTGKELVEKIAAAFSVKPRYMIAGKLMFSALGLFNHDVKEIVETLYQWEYDYILDSSKFEKAFGIRASPVDEAIRQSVNSYK